MFCHFVFLHRSNTVPDPNLEIRGEGPVSPPIFFWSFWPQFCLPPPKQHSARSRPWNEGEKPGLPSNFFLALWASVWSKNKGGGQPPQEPSPGSTTATQPCPIKGFLVAILSTSTYSVPLMSFSKYHNCLTNLVKVTCSLLWKISWGICANQSWRNIFNEWW